MYARVTQVQGSPEKVAAGIESFKGQVVPAVKDLDGFKAVMLLVDRDSGKGYGISLWDTEEARSQGTKAVEQARAATIKEMGGGSPGPAEEYEIAFSEGL